MKLADSLNPATQAENIKKLNAGLEAVDARTLPGTSTATTGQILKLTGENKTPAWADEYSYTPPAYSETELNTGKKWIDNKDVYCIVFTGTLSSTDVQHHSLTYANIISMGGTVIGTGTNARTYDLNKSVTIFTISGDDGVNIPISSSYNGYTYYLILYYTKPDPEPETRDDDTQEAPEEVKETKTRKKTTK